MERGSQAPPRNGPLSGMAVTWAAAALAVVVGNFAPAALAARFSAAPSRALLDAFFVSILLMVAHKGESYLAREYDRCPVYLTSGARPWAKNPRQAIFVAFVSTFLGMMLLVYGVMAGPPWPLLLLAVWLAQGLHELHHPAKALAERRYYPGTVTAILFVAWMGLRLLPAWMVQVRGATPHAAVAYGVLAAALFAAYYAEHRRWLARGGARYVGLGGG